VFRTSAGRANIAALITASAGAIILVLALFDAPGAVLLGVGIAGAVIGATGAFLTQRLKQQNMLQRWMVSRADAETQRQAYFERVVLVEEPGGNAGIPLAVLQLEYFRRFQLDVQLRYYDDKQRKARRAADRTIAYAAGATFFGALSTGLAGLLGSGNPDWAGLAALGILGTSLASYSAVREAIGQDARNAARFEQTRVALRDLYAHLDEVRDAVASGNRAALHEFVTAAHDNLSLEHRQWLREAELAHNGLARLEQVLRGDELSPEPARGDAEGAGIAAPPGG
jgi:hypothetical protein